MRSRSGLGKSGHTWLVSELAWVGTWAWPGDAASSTCSVVEGVSRRLHGLRGEVGELRWPLPLRL